MDSIHLLQYRNYADKTFDLGQYTVFIGPNGSGKTNVIEAIRTISVTKSYRVTQDKEAIQWGQSYCRVILHWQENDFEYVLTTEGGLMRKVIKHNGVSIPLADVYGLVPTVLFSPETMQLIDGDPQERRRFLDTLLSQVDHVYLESLMVYRKVLRERHYVLLRIQSGLGSEDELDYWEEELGKRGSYIMNARNAFITELNELLKNVYAHFIAEKPQQFVIHYRMSADPETLTSAIKKQRRYDIKTATTKIGPHRDELVFLLDDRDVRLFASRGELRRCILSTKIAEAMYLKEHKETPPIILLDDVFSELDMHRRIRLREAIKEYRAIITTTDESFINELQLESPVIHKLTKE